MKTIIQLGILLLIIASCKKDDGNNSSNTTPTGGTGGTGGNNEPTSVYIFSAVATPTDSESITIKNNAGVTADLTGWTLGDTNDPTAHNIAGGTSLTQGETKFFSHTTLGFQINDSGEILYLKDSNGSTIDTWSN